MRPLTLMNTDMGVEEMKQTKMFGVLLVAAMTLAACGQANKSANENVSSEVATSSSDRKESVKEAAKDTASLSDDELFVETADQAHFDGKILKGNSYSIVITDVKVLTPGETGNTQGDKPVMAFFYDTVLAENYDNSVEISPYMAWTLNFKAIQDNDPNLVNQLKEAFSLDENLIDKQFVTIKAGGRVSSAIAYELTDQETPVTLVAGDLIGRNFGKHDFEVK